MGADGILNWKIYDFLGFPQKLNGAISTLSTTNLAIPERT